MNDIGEQGSVAPFPITRGNNPLFTASIIFIVFLLVCGAFAQSDTLADSLNMHLVASMGFPAVIHDIAAQDSYVFLAGGDTLYIVNIADPDDPEIVKRIYSSTYWGSIDVEDTLLCGGGSMGFKVVNISQINSAAVIGTTSAGTNGISMSLSSQLAIGNRSELYYIIDISAPDSPYVDTTISDYTGDIMPSDFFLRDTLLYSAGFYYEDISPYGFEVAKYVIINLADLSDIEIVGEKDFINYGIEDWMMTRCLSIVANDDGAFVGGEFTVTSGFWYREECDSLLQLLVRGRPFSQDLFCNYLAIKENLPLTDSTRPNINSVYQIAGSCSLTLLGYYRMRRNMGIALTEINDSLYLVSVGKNESDENKTLYIIKIDSHEVDIQDCKLIPSERAELSVYPNPFNSSISISAPEGAKVEIFDLRGNVVGAGLAPAQQQGDRKSHPYIWQPEKEITSGIYLIRATTKDGLTETKRIIYLR